MKPRNLLSPAEVESLHEELGHKLAALGLESRPAVAGRILELARDPGAGPDDYAAIVRNDAALTGRLIRIANSAFFAQRHPVTNVERACVLLGVERLRSMSLGFYLSRAAATDAGQRLSREVWGQSVYRACLAAEIARKVVPECAAEAFVIGLMLDAGIPLSFRVLGPTFESVHALGLPPTESHSAELCDLPFTHVDVVTALIRRWKFPELLAKPIEWHHSPPAPSTLPEPVHLLHRVAFCVGALALRPDGRPTSRSTLTHRAYLPIEPGVDTEIIARATAQYETLLDLFSDVADSLEATAMAAAVHQQLVEVIDEQMSAEFADATRPREQQFRLGGLTLTLRPEAGGVGAAYTYDSGGEPLSTYRFMFASETVESLREALGLEPHWGDDIDAIAEYIEKIAA